MSTLNPPRKITTRPDAHEEKAITAYARAWDFYDKNKKIVYGALAGLVIVALGIVGYTLYQGQRSAEAQQLLGQIVSAYETGDYRTALDGTDGNPGLLEIAEDYGNTEAGNLAHFYAADALYQLNDYDAALSHFQAFDKSKDFIGASAYAGEAAIYENKEQFREAGDLYQKAALFFTNDLMSPQYLLDAGRAYELAGAYDAAREAYQMIGERFPESSQASGVDFYLARLDAKASKENA